jgi:hypothetical protein
MAAKQIAQRRILFWLAMVPRRRSVGVIGVRAETGRVILSYRHRLNEEPGQDVEYLVLIEWTPCEFGGSRAWFLCPARGCGRRVAILYSGTTFACRKCHKLIYQSQKQRVWQRAMSRARFWTTAVHRDD